MNDIFRKVSAAISNKVGSSSAFLVAFLLVVIWVASGPVFNFSSNWQLVINTGTTIITFLMVFLIQNTQNRDTKAMQLKLDELLRAGKGARTGLVDIEDLSDEEIEALAQDFHKLHDQTSSKITLSLRKAVEEEHARRRAHGMHLGNIFHRKDQ